MGKKGRYITKVGFVDVYAQDTYKKVEKGDKNKTPQVASTELVIYQGKHRIASGLKSIQDATEKAIAHMGDKYQSYIA